MRRASNAYPLRCRKGQKAPLTKRVILAALAVVLLVACGNLHERQQDSVFPSPVAFVTAGPLPQPSPTLTLPPLQHSTDVPPTAAPKKLPLESTSAIGSWSDQIASSQSFTGVVDLATGDAALELRKSNFALVALNKRQVFYGLGNVLSDTLANHPKWVLYDKNGKVTFSLASPQDPLLDVREEEVKTMLADDVAKLVNDGGYDGIVLEGVGAELIRKETPPVFTSTKTFTDEQRRDTVEGLLRAIRARLPDKLIIVGGYAWSDGAAYNVKPDDAQMLSTYADGIHIDEFLRAPFSDTTAFKTESNWKKDVDYLAAISQDGKTVLITTRLRGVDVTTDTIKQWLDYSVASYLLGKNGSRTYFQYDPQGTLAFANDPMLTAPVGAPLEAYAKLDSGLYQRLFTNGIVLVNPTGETKETELETEYRLLGGAELIKKVSMTAHTGLILLKP